ncbi:AraC family transcriptional regulator [Mycobacteroides abscessus]|uniref:AraC family transcriptional regulator n=5 Tax=Mycobacteroides abscessus TaxID=36809 RepID=A0A1U0TXE9_9MYCO|nr:AraC family transcriptional regulator [Mycobacteroides abscessus]ESV64848.1 bacterial regulatory helix-turn-helix s, AraC family protein [Mycobacteroides abscessus MAB_091912_2446]EUA67082.1 bacterial regulatory helix-turn-helix s, AraC family protein [Mycobacteroides abscessus subsp. bolletii 1513]AGM30231.1 AraC family transcriptional regulator [Mycobacteroides abscessus subsp. bolletii 50594]AIC71556.1 AraC family transcriptional regulator [Mycobacteroides abscessus subsp. massiliense str
MNIRLVRFAALSGYVDVARASGLDPARMMREHGLDPAGLAQPDRRVAADAVIALLEASADASGVDDFGLRLAERRRLSSLGPLSLALREQPTVRDVVAMLCRHESMYNESLRIRVVERDGIAAVRLALDAGGAAATQSTDLALAALAGVLRTFLSNTWHPLRVNLRRPRPSAPAMHHRIFGPRIEFAQQLDEIVVYTSDLDRRNDSFDPLLRQYSQAVLEPPERPGDTTTTDRVRDLIEVLLPVGRCSVEQVARGLGVDRRTVHRQLASEGTSFSALLDTIRLDLADHLVTSDRHSLTEISEMLAFSSPSNFSRWFRGHRAMSPRTWRNLRADAIAAHS